MDYDRQLEKEFFDYLLSIGYPKESIIYQPATHPVQSMKCYRPSFALINPENEEYLGIIEIKESRIADGKNIYRNMSDYCKVIAKKSLPVYIVSTSEDEDAPFILNSFDETGCINAIDHHLFPEFKTLSVKESTDRKSDLRTRSANVSDKFRSVCWLASFILFSLAISDVVFKELYDVTLLTAERLSILGGALALIVIPFAQKFKGLGIEWEKSTAGNKSES